MAERASSDVDHNPPEPVKGSPSSASTPERQDLDLAPSETAFAAEIVPASPRHRAVRKLHALLAQIDPRAERHRREEQFQHLVEWVRSRGAVPVGDTGFAMAHPQAKRLALLAAAMERFPPYRERVSRLIQTILYERSALGLFSKVGIPGDRGLFSETVDRLSERLMPQPLDEQDLTVFLVQLFERRSDADWIESLNPKLVAWFSKLSRAPQDATPAPLGSAIKAMISSRASIHAEATLSSGTPLTEEEQAPSSLRMSMLETPLGEPPAIPELRLSVPPESRHFSVFSPLKVAVLEATLLLASRVSAAGLSDVIRARSPVCALQDSAFFRLPRAIDSFLATPRHDVEGAAELAAECELLSDECRDIHRVVVARLETQGVSIDVVYRLELIDRCLRRIEVLLGLLVPQPSEQAASRQTLLLAQLLRDYRRDRSLFDIVQTNTRLLARKIIERAGQTGEHYISITRREYGAMLYAAAGGGVLTAGTAAIKVFVLELHRAPFQEGLLLSANYAGSFLVMQMLGFSLATKQSSMTAATLAGSIKKTGDTTELATMISRVTRSQLAAAMGNVVMVIPACLLFDKLWMLKYSEHFYDVEHAKGFVASLDPTKSGTPFYAATAGVMLWLSSLFAGWLENWAVYRRIPEAIAEHRIQRVVGSRVTRWASRVFARNIAGFGGNVSIGFLLGMPPILGKFVGLPIDIRHITLSTGALTLSWLQLGSAGIDMTMMALSIAIIGAMNFGVSFVLALSVAMRAREVSFAQALRMLLGVVGGFFRSPLRFFLPVEKIDPGEVQKPH